MRSALHWVGLNIYVLFRQSILQLFYVPTQPCQQTTPAHVNAFPIWCASSTSSHSTFIIFRIHLHFTIFIAQQAIKGSEFMAYKQRCNTDG